MKVIACYNIKGGVGKSTLAVNLAWASATQSARRTLLWDLDPQGGAGFLLGVERRSGDAASERFGSAAASRSDFVPTRIPLLDVCPADRSLHGIDGILTGLGKKRRLAKLTASLAQWYDRIILDCPPVMNELTRQVMRAADVVIVPVGASPLARRALDDVIDDLARHHARRPPVLPVFSMYDARRKLHVEAREEEPAWPAIPMASVVEKMAVHRLPVGAFAPRSPAAMAVRMLWAGIERKLADAGNHEPAGRAAAHASSSGTASQWRPDRK